MSGRFAWVREALKRKESTITHDYIVEETNPKKLKKENSPNNSNLIFDELFIVKQQLAVAKDEAVTTKEKMQTSNKLWQEKMDEAINTINTLEDRIQEYKAQIEQLTQSYSDIKASNSKDIDIGPNKDDALKLFSSYTNILEKYNGLTQCRRKWAVLICLHKVWAKYCSLLHEEVVDGETDVAEDAAPHEKFLSFYSFLVNVAELRFAKNHRDAWAKKASEHAIKCGMSVASTLYSLMPVYCMAQGISFADLAPVNQIAGFKSKRDNGTKLMAVASILCALPGLTVCYLTQTTAAAPIEGSTSISTVCNSASRVTLMCQEFPNYIPAELLTTEFVKKLAAMKASATDYTIADLARKYRQAISAKKQAEKDVKLSKKKASKKK